MNFSLFHLVLIMTILIYFALIVVTRIGIRQNRFTLIQNESTVSVILVAHNEEKSIDSCLDSLQSLEYPQDKLEFILVNDRSSDQTSNLMESFAKKNTNAKVIHVHEDPFPKTGKINGLIQGIRASSGNFLFFTDADCLTPPSWIQSTLSNFDKQTGIVGGFLLLESPGIKSNLFGRLQAIDWILITTVGAAWANLGFPLSVFGNNYAIRRDIYDTMGGFEEVTNYMIEDFALTKNMIQKTSFKVRIPCNPKNSVITLPANSIREFFIQRKRWAIGGRSHGFLAYTLMGITFLIHLLIVLAWISRFYLLGSVSFLVVFFSDFFLLHHPLRILKRYTLIWDLFLYELFYFGYTLFFAPIFLFSKKVLWKSNLYTVSSEQTRK